MDNASKKVLETVEKRVVLKAQNKVDLIESQGDLLQQRIVNLRALGEANAKLAELRSALGINYREAFPR